MISIEAITRQLCPVYKAVRLRALSESPTAFGSTFAEESQLTDGEWEARIEGNETQRFAGWLAFEDGEPCGLVGCYMKRHEPDDGHVVSMWVAPGLRRRGVGRLLIEQAIEWAASHGARAVTLWAAEHNDVAISFYEQIGFTKTGTVGANSKKPTMREFLMRLAIGSGD